MAAEERGKLGCGWQNKALFVVAVAIEISGQPVSVS
jgi:hypothetical protein